MFQTPYEVKKQEMMKKYDANIKGIGTEQNVDMGVAFDMLVSNYKCAVADMAEEIKHGGGIVDFAELGKDIAELDFARSK